MLYGLRYKIFRNFGTQIENYKNSMLWVNAGLLLNFKLTLFSLCGKWTFSISVKHQFVSPDRKYLTRVTDNLVYGGPESKKNVPIIVIAESEVAVNDKATVSRVSAAENRKKSNF